MNRRPLTVLLTTCALLAQSWAIAGMAPTMAVRAAASAAVEAEAMPCHGTAAQDQATDGGCCDEASACAQVCASATGMIFVSKPPQFVAAAEPVVAATASHTLAAHRYTPLRPPIASQS